MRGTRFSQAEATPCHGTFFSKTFSKGEDGNGSVMEESMSLKNEGDNDHVRIQRQKIRDL